MEHIKIIDYPALMLQIEQLKVDKRQQEMKIKGVFKEFAQSLRPVELVKQSIGELAADKEVQFNLAKMGLIAGTDFIIDKVVGRNRSVKGFLGSVLIENFTSKFIKNNAPSILLGISNAMLKIAK